MATQVDIHGMQAATKTAEDVHHRMIGTLKGVEMTVQEFSGAWQGDAFKAFGNVTAEYQQAATKMNSAMEQIISMLNKNMGQYAAQEEQAVGQLKSTVGGINTAV